MKLTHPEPETLPGDEKPFKYYDCSTPTFSLLTQSPNKSEVGAVTVHLSYAGPMGAPASQLLILSPEELAVMDRLRGMVKAL